jgi:hypothetical protein
MRAGLWWMLCLLPVGPAGPAFAQGDLPSGPLWQSPPPELRARTLRPPWPNLYVRRAGILRRRWFVDLATFTLYLDHDTLTRDASEFLLSRVFASHPEIPPTAVLSVVITIKRYEIDDAGRVRRGPHEFGVRMAAFDRIKADSRAWSDRLPPAVRDFRPIDTTVELLQARSTRPEHASPLDARFGFGSRAHRSRDADRLDAGARIEARAARL